MARTKDVALERRRRDQIMATALRLLSQDSFHAVTLARVARASGVSKGMVTYYFETKDALLSATIARHYERQQRLLAGIVASPRSLEQRLDALLMAAFGSYGAVAAEAGFVIEVWSYAKTHPDIRRRLGAASAQFRQACGALVDSALGAPGSAAAAEHRARRVQAVHALFDGLSLQVAADPDIDLASARQTARDAMITLLQG